MIHEQAAHSADSKPDGEQREELKGKHNQLTRELVEVRNKVYHVEKEIKALQKEILEAGEWMMLNICIYSHVAFIYFFLLRCIIKIKIFSLTQK